MLKVNGKAYDWGDVDLKIPGLNIQVQEISYDDELEIEEVYGSGSKPRGYGTGNYKASGKLSMLRDDYDDLLAYCKQKGVPFYKMELPSIIVSYANEGARTKIDELKKVKFSKRSNKAAQGDKSLTVDVDMMIVGGVYQDGVAPVYDNILVKSSVTVSQNISVTVTTDTADTDEAVENRVKAILTELLAVRRSRKLNELTLSDINHAIRSGYSGATNAAVSEPEADVKLGKDKVITLGDVSVTVERE